MGDKPTFECNLHYLRVFETKTGDFPIFNIWHFFLGLINEPRRTLEHIINVNHLSYTTNSEVLDEFEEGSSSAVIDTRYDKELYWIPFLVFENENKRWVTYALCLSTEGKEVFLNRMKVLKGGRKSRKNRALTKRRTLQNRRRYSTNTKGKKMRRRSRHRI